MRMGLPKAAMRKLKELYKLAFERDESNVRETGVKLRGLCFNCIVLVLSILNKSWMGSKYKKIRVVVIAMSFGCW